MARSIKEGCRASATLWFVVFASGLSFAFAAWIWSGGTPFRIDTNVRHTLAAAGWNPVLAGKAANALVVTSETILLALVVLLVFRLRPRQLGVAPPPAGSCSVSFSVRPASSSRR